MAHISYFICIQIGDIFNFETGTKLNKLLVGHDQVKYDEYIWNNDYDKI